MDQTYFFWVGVAAGTAVTASFLSLLFALMVMAVHTDCEERYLTSRCSIEAVPYGSQIIPP